MVKNPNLFKMYIHENNMFFSFLTTSKIAFYVTYFTDVHKLCRSLILLITDFSIHPQKTFSESCFLSDLCFDSVST